MTAFTAEKSDQKQEVGKYTTFKEIKRQPRLWRETIGIIKDKREEINSFLNKALSKEGLRIIIAGAGSSAFVGDSVATYLDAKLKHRVETIATTDIVSNPDVYFKSDVPTLLISCARSGNSPESVATVELAESIIKDLYQIFITCNPNSNLMKKAQIDVNKLLLLMPEDSNDQGFAMTGSFTSMVLASLLIFDLDNLEELEKRTLTIADTGEWILENHMDTVFDITYNDMNRAIFLGSNSLNGLAEESALKVLELTGGCIVTNSDTSLGFRHGPKSILDDKTIVFSYISNNKYTRQYEIDLLKEIKREGGHTKVVAISNGYYDEIKELVDNYIYISDEEHKDQDDVFLLFNYLLYAQLFAIIKSVELGKNPDNPCPEGIVNRVVQGVKIYPYTYK